jgi:hypothetical protein
MDLWHNPPTTKCQPISIVHRKPAVAYLVAYILLQRYVFKRKKN